MHILVVQTKSADKNVGIEHTKIHAIIGIVINERDTKS